MFDFKGKTVLITGASYGLGEQFAYACSNWSVQKMLPHTDHRLLISPYHEWPEHGLSSSSFFQILLTQT